MFLQPVKLSFPIIGSDVLEKVRTKHLHIIPATENSLPACVLQLAEDESITQIEVWAIRGLWQLSYPLLLQEGLRLLRYMRSCVVMLDHHFIPGSSRRREKL